MRKSLIVVAGVLLAACGGNNGTATSTDSASAKKDSMTAVQPINPVIPVLYSSSFTIDEPKNAESVLKLWKSYEDGNVASTKDLIGDSITVYTGDGMVIHGTRDSTTAMVQKERDMYKSVADSVEAIIAVKSDKGDHWALIWGTENWVDKKGKPGSMELHQAWMFNAQGQAVVMREYEAKTPKMPGMPTKK